MTFLRVVSCSLLIMASLIYAIAALTDSLKRAFPTLVYVQLFAILLALWEIASKL